MKPKFWLIFDLLIVAILLLSGCVGGGSKGWSGPVVDEDALYVGTRDGKLISYTLVTEPRPAAVEWWRFPPRGEPGLGGSIGGGFLTCAPSVTEGIYSTPVVADGVVYIGTYDGKVYAIDAVLGTALWQYPQRGDIGSIVGSPVVEGGILYIGSSDGKLYALDAETGQEVWPQPFQTDNDIWATPAVYDGVVYIGSFDHSLYAIDAETGAEIWEFETDAAIGSTPLVYNDTIYIGSFDSKFYAINLDGTQKWRFEGADNWFWSKAVVYDDTIIAGSLDHRVYALDAETGDERWQFETEGEILAEPALVGSVVIIGSDDDRVYALDVATGDPAWRSPFFADGHIRAPIFAGDDRVYIYTTAGTLYALGVEDGRKLWHEVTRE